MQKFLTFLLLATSVVVTAFRQWEVAQVTFLAVIAFMLWDKFYLEEGGPDGEYQRG